MAAGAELAAGAAAAVSSLAAGLAAGAEDPPESSTESSSSIEAILIPTSMVSPSSNKTSAIRPENGDGISDSTLSVEISRRISSISTLSPTFLCHLVMVPLVIDSPI